MMQSHATEKPETYAIPALDIQQYYLMNGPMTNVIVYEFTLDDIIDQTEMNAALEATLEDFPCFRFAPAIENNEIRFIKNETPATVFPADGHGRKLGEASAAGYMFVVTVDGKQVSTHFHHSISDGRGCLAFAITLLMHYFSNRGIQFEAADWPKNQSTGAPYVFYGEKERKAGTDYEYSFTKEDPKTFFHRPEPLFSAEEHQNELYTITCPLQPVLDRAHFYHTKPAAYLSALLADSYRAVYPVGNQTILGMVTVDCRNIFHDEAANNAPSAVFVLDFDRERKETPGRQAVMDHTRRDVDVNEETVAAAVKMQVARVNQFKALSAKMPVLDVVHLISGKTSGPQLTTYGLSYVGSLRLPAGLEPHVPDVNFFYSNYNYEFFMSAVEYKGTFQICCSQNSAGPTLAKAFYETLKEEIPDTTLSDASRFQFDSFYLENMPQL